MGWFDGASEVGSSHHGKHHHHHHGSSSKHSTTGSIFGSGERHHNSSRSSFFGVPTRSSSYYKRSPRSGYLQRIYKQLRRLLRDLIHYMKRNPLKVFVLVIMPLITGGALSGLLNRFGIRLPGGLEKMFRGAAGGGVGGAYGPTSIGRGRDGGLQFERTKVDGPLAALSGLGSLAGGMGGVGGAMSLAKMFL